MDSFIENENDYFELNSLLQDEVSILLNKCKNILEEYELLDKVYNIREELIKYEFEYTEERAFYISEIFEFLSEVGEIMKEEMDIELMINQIETINY